MCGLLEAKFGPVEFRIAVRMSWCIVHRAVLEHDAPILRMSSKKNSASLPNASDVFLSASISRYKGFTTRKPNLSGYRSPVSTSSVSVSASIKSDLVRMPIVRRP